FYALENGGVHILKGSYDKAHGKGALVQDLEALAAKYPLNNESRFSRARAAVAGSPRVVRNAIGRGASAVSAVFSTGTSSVGAAISGSTNAARKTSSYVASVLNNVFRPENYTTRGFVVKASAITAGLAAFGAVGYFAYTAGSLVLTAG